MRTIDYNRFITDMLKHVSSADSPDMVLNQIIQYICIESDSDRAYIFEDNPDGTSSNTYEYCRQGIKPEIDNLQNVPYKAGFDLWANAFEGEHNILIYDIEEYRGISEDAYRLLKPQGINTLVAGPLVLDGKRIGFYGLDNPPRESIDELSTLISFIEFIINMMIRIRNGMKEIEMSSKRDPLTGCSNRMAMEWAYDNEFDGTSDMCVIACDLNGLKLVNDVKGHKAGDQFICDVAELLCQVFGRDNVYRLGGDEFAVIKQGETKEQIKKEIEDFDAECREKDVSVSIGYEFREEFSGDFNQLLQAADKKMYQAKSRYYLMTGKDRRRSR